MQRPENHARSTRDATISPKSVTAGARGAKIKAMQDPLAAARGLLAGRLEFSDVLAKLSPKDRGTAERRVTALETEGDPRQSLLWRRLVSTLVTLAPHAAKFVGRQTAQFYLSDGRYRKQVFALEDLQDGIQTVYCPDVLEEAIAARCLSRIPHADPHMFGIPSSGQLLRVELLDGESIDPSPHFKDMTGWNRKIYFRSPA
jgi:hypothetical protein